MILAPVTVRCSSNSCSASSTSGLLAPAAQSSVDRVVPPALASRGRLCYRGGLTAPYYSHRWPGHPSTHPHPCYSSATTASQRSQTSEPSYSSPHGHPLPRLPRLRVFPFLGLAIVHRLGALGAAWSMWSTTNFHWKSTIRGEADSWVHDSRKEVHPYYVQNNYSST